MHTEAASADDKDSSLASIGATFNVEYIGDITIEEVRRIQAELTSHIERAIQLVPYLANTYREDRQRRMAECQLLWLQKRIEELGQSLPNTFQMIGFLQYSAATLES